MNNHISRPAAILLGLFMVAASSQVHAQGYLADAQISNQPVGNGTYDYTLVLNNEMGAVNSIETFWFAWTDAGYDLLPSVPTVTGTPTGWASSVMGGGYSYYYGYDGYSIEFTTSTAPLAPGQSLTFQFNSPDAPSALNANSSSYPYIPVGTSFVYMGAAGADAGSQFLVVPVPEPSTTSLMAIAAASLLFMGGKKFRWFQAQPVLRILNGVHPE